MVEVARTLGAQFGLGLSSTRIGRISIGLISRGAGGVLAVLSMVVVHGQQPSLDARFNGQFGLIAFVVLLIGSGWGSG